MADRPICVGSGSVSLSNPDPILLSEWVEWSIEHPFTRSATRLDERSCGAMQDCCEPLKEVSKLSRRVRNLVEYFVRERDHNRLAI